VDVLETRYARCALAIAAGQGETRAINTIRDLVAGSGLQFEDRGTHELKGVPGAWHMYRVVG
jgi:hypothetical protein